jgi:tRNA A-37 threonylcarbamoyl transferase component Bud32
MKHETAMTGLTVPRTGAVLGGKYRVIAKVGEGGMGTVFRAENVVTGKHVAVKWMHPHVAANSDAAERLLREAQAASRLTHPNVVDVYDIVQDDQTLFLVMELLEGETLGSCLQRNPHPKISEFIALLLPAMEGVAAAHDKGVIHRDLKPDNIFLVRVPGSTRVTAKVVDFGIAKVAGTQGLTLTGTGMSLGTPLYMSLEQLRGDKDVDARADVYAFGVILYEAITGYMPYSATTLSELAIKVATTDAVPVKELRPDVPTQLARAVDWAIARKREQRLPNVRALIQELDAFAQDYSFRNQMTNQAAALPRLAENDELCAATEQLETPDALLHMPPMAAAARASAAPRPAAHAAQVATSTATEGDPHANAGALTVREPSLPRSTRMRWLPIGLAGVICVVIAIVVAEVSMRTASRAVFSPTPRAATASSPGAQPARPASAPVQFRVATHPPQPAAAALPGPGDPGAASAPQAVFRPLPNASEMPTANMAPVAARAPHRSATPKPHKPAPTTTATAPMARAQPAAAAKPQAASPGLVKPPAAGKSAADLLAF